MRPGLLILLVLAACHKSAPAAQVASVRDVGAVSFPAQVRARDGGYSVGWGSKSVWVFGDTTLRAPGEDGPSGTSWRSSTSSWTESLDASAGLRVDQQVPDSKGAPRELLPFTAEETAYNAAHRGTDCPAGSDCGARWALWPAAIVPDPARGRALLFYSKIAAKTGAYNFKGVGTSIASWAAPEAAPVRSALRPGTAEPTLLFPDGEPPLGAGGVVVADQLYAYGCACAGLRCPCLLGRAPLAAATDRAQWTFWNGSAFSADAAKAAPVFDGSPAVSVQFNAHLGRYLALYSIPVGNDIGLRTADRPEGPWSDQLTVTSTPPPPTAGAWNYAGVGHPELAKDSGRIEYLSYFHDLGNFDGEMKLLEITFR